MNKKLLISSLFLCYGAMAQVSPLSGYQTTNISISDAEQVWKNMKTSFIKKSECFNRAQSWTYDTEKKFGFKGKKILIHYSYKYNQELSAKWGFHIAPVYNVEGEDIVFDKGFGSWLHTPITKKMWEEKFLGAGTSKLVEKRIKLDKKRSELNQDLKSLDPEGDFYFEKRLKIKKKLQEVKEEMIYFGVTDSELKKQKPKKIEQLERTISFLKEELSKVKTTAIKNSVSYQLKNAKSLLKKVKRNLNYAAHIQCKKIDSIEELDFGQTKAWCYIQEVSQYYWGVPQLRLLNYGQYSRPYEDELSSKRIAGEAYIMDKFNMEQVWIARKQAFGREYKEIWKKEYDQKEYEKNKDKIEKKKDKEKQRAKRAKKRALEKEQRKKEREQRRRNRRNSRN
ncbi:MAG: protein-glutamine glutaminase family protein [Bacteriovoracaceae bacterium]|jgi:hypothetical protein|nr:protein-glutamine glutaminase family protein [Bacteriovoracaceae bacterium]